MNAIIPIPRCPIQVRQATEKDISFIDGLQKIHSHMVSFLQFKALEGKIKAGHVLVAEERDEETKRRRDEVKSVGGESSTQSLRHSVSPSLLGYCIGQDQYSGRDDVGVIYQLNVLPLKQRHLIGATLVKAMFDRAAYGCKLFCLWCAQDIQANFFWESIGFVPLAFRTGSRAKQRIHIYWQKRVRDGDTTTPWWFPSNTKSGMVREDRLVFPIPRGVHWRDPMPVLLPNIAVAPPVPKPLTLPGGAAVSPRPEQPKLTHHQKAAIHRAQSRHLAGVPLGKKAVLTSSGIKYVERTDFVPETDTPEELVAPKKEKRPAKPKLTHDPEFFRKTRELRDRFLEDVNSDPMALPNPETKYQVVKQIEQTLTPALSRSTGRGSKLLDAA